MRAIGTAALLVIAAGGAQAEYAPLTSRTFVERAMPGAGVRLEPLPDRLRSGDRVVVVVRATAASGPDPLIVTQPIPSGLRFADVSGGGVTVSVDGGRRFGALADLSVRAASGTERPARTDDVTHLRWRVDTTTGARRTFSFRGVVR